MTIHTTAPVRATSMATPVAASLATLAAMLALAGSAQAQSGIVLAGVLDMAARSVHNAGAGSMRSIVSGSNSTSRLVVRGTEDLGGGLSAGFWLESGLTADTGSASGGQQFWDRRSTLSLVSSTLGELRLGRDYVPTYTAWTRLDPFSHVGVAGSNNFGGAGPTGPIRAAFGSNPNTTVRSNNTLQLLLPGGLGGVEGGVMAAPGETGTAASGAGKLLGARLGWSSPAFGVVVATTETRNDITGNAGRFRDTMLGASASLGGFKLTAGWRQFRFANAKQTNLMLGAIYAIGTGEIKASVVKGNLAGRVGNTNIDANDALQLGLGYVHHLSKRTALYATVARIDNDGRANFVIPGGPTLAAGRTSTGYEAGMRHSF